jgi:hypothetical protein
MKDTTTLFGYPFKATLEMDDGETIDITEAFKVTYTGHIQLDSSKAARLVQEHEVRHLPKLRP